MLIKQLTNIMQILASDMKNKLRENLSDNTDSSKVCLVIEKHYPNCKASRAKDVLNKWNEEIS